MLLTAIFGIWMIVLNPTMLKQGWLHAKLTAVLVLIGYHIFLGLRRKKLANGEFTIQEKTWRMLNERELASTEENIAAELLKARAHAQESGKPVEVVVTDGARVVVLDHLVVVLLRVQIHLFRVLFVLETQLV